MDTRAAAQQYRLNQWTEIIRECRSSGQTISSWCAEHNINIKSYYYWLKRVRMVACESLPVISDGEQQIVPIRMPSSPAKVMPMVSESSSHIILHMGSVTLELKNGATTDLIENTLRALTHVR